VLALAVTTHLYPRLEAERFGAGRLTKIRAQAVSGASCRVVAERLEVPRRMQAAAPPGWRRTRPRRSWRPSGCWRRDRGGNRGLLSGCGLRTHAAAVVEAFGPEIEQALEHPLDFKSALQELLARRGAEVSYEITSETGPPHDKTFEVAAKVNGQTLGNGRGKSKKHAEQEAARGAVDELASDR